MSRTDLIDALPLAALTGNAPPHPSEIEREVIDLFEQLSGSLMRYTLAFGIPVYDAEQIVQEVFLALFQHLQLGRPRTNLRGWIFRVAHNLALRQRITNKRECDRTGDHGLIEQRCDPSPNPEEHLSSVQRQQHLLAIVNALPAADQSCLRLRAEGLRYREVASVLGISLGAVALSLTRSLARLNRADKG